MFPSIREAAGLQTMMDTQVFGVKLRSLTRYGDDYREGVKAEMRIFPLLKLMSSDFAIWLPTR